MNLRIASVFVAALLAATMSHAQSASLSASASAAPAGTVLTITAAANYAATPAALGWSVNLPEGWTFVATAGPDTPQVVPQEGATGTVEWAYASVPANAASFRFTVRVAGKAGNSRLEAKVFVRSNGQQQTVEAAPTTITVLP